MCNELQHLPEQFNLPRSSQSVDGLTHCVNILLLVHVGRPNHQGLWHSRVLHSTYFMNAVVMFLIQSSVIGALACSGSVTAVVRNTAQLPCSGDSRTIAPLPCCGCAFMYRCHGRMTCTCSATRLSGRHPSRCSAPLFHNHVGVICTLAVRTACLASRVACVRAWSWLSHPRPPDRSQHGCTVGVDRDPPV